MDNIDIRKGLKSEIVVIKKLSKSLCEYDRDNFDNTLNCEWLDSEYGNNFLLNLFTCKDSCVFVANFNGTMIGYLFGEISDKLPWRNIGKQSELIEIFILPEYRGKNIGGLLLEKFKQWSINKGVKNIRLLVSNGNQKSISFYNKNGFTNYDLTLEYNIK